MVEADFSGDYLNSENAKQDDIGEIIGEGNYVEIEKDGKVRRILNIPVLVNNKKKIYSPSRESGKKLIKAFGNNTVKWIGTKFKIDLVAYKSFGETKQTIEIQPITTETA